MVSGNLVRRCKWCLSRIGQCSYALRSDNCWFPASSFLLNDDSQFTDGICPDCFDFAISQISRSASPAHDVSALDGEGRNERVGHV